MKMRKLVSLALVLAMSAALLSGCAKAPEAAAPAAAEAAKEEAAPAAAEAAKEEAAPAAAGVVGDRNGDGVIKLGFANIAETVYQHTKIKESFEKACADRGWELVYMNNNLDGQQAVSNAEKMLQMGIDYMAEYNVDQSVAPNIMKAMNEAGVPVVAIDIGHEGAVYFGANNYGIGPVVGEYAGKLVKDTWGEAEAILIVEDPISGEAVLARTDNIIDGYRKVFPDFPDDKLFKVDGGADSSDSQKVVSDFLSAHPDFHKILVCPAHVTMRVGTSAAIEINEREQDCLIVSQGEYDYLDYLKSTPQAPDWEVFRASAVYNFQSYGEEVCKIVDKMIAGETLQEEYNPEHYMIDRTNYKDNFADYFEE